MPGVYSESEFAEDDIHMYIYCTVNPERKADKEKK
jgi:hypothetical protein